MLVPAEFRRCRTASRPARALRRVHALYLHDGRGLAAYTHDDVLYQSYFVAYLVLDTLNGGSAA